MLDTTVQRNITIIMFFLSTQFPQMIVSQRFMYSLPQELANIVVLKEYLDNIKGVFFCYANIFEPLLSYTVLFGLSLIVWGSESLPKL